MSKVIFEHFRCNKSLENLSYEILISAVFKAFSFDTEGL